MKNEEKIAFLTYFLELTEQLKCQNMLENNALKCDISLSGRKKDKEINDKASIFFWKCYEFMTKDELSLARKPYLEDNSYSVRIPLDRFSLFLKKKGVNFDVDVFFEAIYSILNERSSFVEVNVDSHEIILYYYDFFILIRSFICELFDYQLNEGGVLDEILENSTKFVRIDTNSSSKNEQKMELIRIDTNCSSKNEQKNSYDTKKRDPKWTKAVLQRDNYKCQCCGYDKRKNLEAHHIYSYRDNEEYRGRIDNGITLCKFCHRKYHSEFGRDGSNPYDLLLFFRKYSISSL